MTKTHNYLSLSFSIQKKLFVVLRCDLTLFLFLSLFFTHNFHSHALVTRLGTTHVHTCARSVKWAPTPQPIKHCRESQFSDNITHHVFRDHPRPTVNWISFSVAGNNCYSMACSHRRALPFLADSPLHASTALTSSHTTTPPFVNYVKRTLSTGKDTSHVKILHYLFIFLPFFIRQLLLKILLRILPRRFLLPRNIQFHFYYTIF